VREQRSGFLTSECRTVDPEQQYRQSKDRMLIEQPVNIQTHRTVGIEVRKIEIGVVRSYLVTSIRIQTQSSYYSKSTKIFCGMSLENVEEFLMLIML
jgi:hypothetical protein